MRRIFEILASSFQIALQELLNNKLRTFLSLFGVTIGIFCIISVLATVNSLEYNIQNEIKSLGTNTIFLDKWDYSNQGPDYPYWKYAKRPAPKFDEVQEIKTRTPAAAFDAFVINTTGTAEVGDNQLNGIHFYGVSEEYGEIQPIDIVNGRYLNDADFVSGSNSVVIGNEIAEKLFDGPERAPGRIITVKGKKNIIIGVIKKQGSQIVGGWQFDKSIIMSYRYARTIMDERTADPLILIKGRDGINSKILKDELRGSMRSIRKLSPVQDDNFALNDVNDFSEAMSRAFISVNVGGWIIGAISFIVGIFGVANIMFVTVKERTAQIGLKKAIGARKNLIMYEFLLESAFLCIIGGVIGLILVFILTRIITSLLHFPIFLSIGIMSVAILICIIAGILAGIVPAYRAATLDPVVAIRS